MSEKMLSPDLINPDWPKRTKDVRVLNSDAAQQRNNEVVVDEDVVGKPGTQRSS